VFFYAENSTVTVPWGTFLRDGKTLLLSVPIDFSKTTFRLWDIANRKKLRRFGGEHYHAYAAALSPDGRTLATGGGDGVIRLWEVLTGKERRQFHGHLGRYYGGVNALAWSPDGKILVSGGADTTVLAWAPLGGDGTKPPASWEKLWRDLGDADAATAFQAMGAMVSAPQQVLPFVRPYLEPMPAPEPDELARLIADLDNDRFAVRDKAARDLEKLGPLARSALEKALAGKTTLELRRRLEAALRSVEEFSARKEWRDVRLIEVLEYIGTTESAQVLETLSREAPDTIGLIARAALERSRQRRTAP
jgi:hypothetical protein